MAGHQKNRSSTIRHNLILSAGFNTSYCWFCSG